MNLPNRGAFHEFWQCPLAVRKFYVLALGLVIPRGDLDIAQILQVWGVGGLLVGAAMSLAPVGDEVTFLPSSALTLYESDPLFLCGDAFLLARCL